MPHYIKCSGARCTGAPIYTAQCLYGAQSILHFCEKCAPDWIKKARTGEKSPPANLFGIVKSWYAKVK